MLKICQVQAPYGMSRFMVIGNRVLSIKTSATKGAILLDKRFPAISEIFLEKYFGATWFMSIGFEIENGLMKIL